MNRHELISSIINHYLSHWTELEKDQYIFDRLWNELNECTEDHMHHIRREQLRGN